jgi:hypothetical protein
MAKSERLFQKIFPNTMEQEVQSLLRILLTVENILLSTTVEYLALLILVFLGQCLIFRGLKNIFYNIFRRSQME